MVLIVNKRSLVVQSNRLVEAKYRLSVEEQKIVKILISQIQWEDVDFQEYEFRVQELAAILGMEHKDTYRVLPRITERLMSRVLKFYNPETETLLQTSWLSSAEYKKGQGTVAMCFDPKLKPLLLQLQSYFTKYELGQVMQFKGQYTIRFFELQKSFLGRNKREVYFSLNELWEILGLRKDEYKVFSNFKIRVLESSRLELLEKTGQSFSWEPVRQGKGGKVVGIRFSFDEEVEEEPKAAAIPKCLPERKEETAREAVSEIVPERRAEIPVVVETPKPEEKPVPVVDLVKNEAVKLLLDCGIAPPVAEELATAYETPYIREKIAILKSHKDWVKSSAGFLVKALQEDWKDPEQEEQRRSEERRQAVQVEAERQARLRALRETFDLHRKNHALHQYEQVPEPTRAIWRSEFLATLAPILKKRYATRTDFGFEDPYYRAFVMQHKLASLSLDEYLQQAGLSLDSEDRRALGTL